MSEYLEMSLGLIESSELVGAELLSALEPIHEELGHNFAVAQMFRSEWEMRNSVLTDMKHPTADSKYWQAVREQQVHFQELVMLSYEYRMNAEKLRVIEAQLAKSERDLKLGIGYQCQEDRDIEEARLGMKRIQAERMRFVMLNQQRTAKDRIREVTSWHRIMAELKPRMRYGTDSYEGHQPESYHLRFQNEMRALQQVGGNSSASEVRNLVGLADMSQKAVRSAELASAKADALSAKADALSR